ncbi:MAG: exosome complex RNA-binding protein Csl4 [Candidatus Bathyarchaeota archaeon]|nr:exosome complex RNA-binding protein Csl4 [Candidatus Bathyarchaeota archaeon]
MKENERKSGLFVVPGDQLGVIEEFTSGSGTYVEDGTIHSQVTGCTLLDMLNRQVSVYPIVPKATVPQVGNIVTGIALDVRSKNAVVRIFQVGDKKLSGFFTGMLHISGVSHGFVDNMYNVVKTGDIIKAKVISTKNRSFFLSTAENDLGVVHALCSICGNELKPGNRGLECSNCGNSERRKRSPDFGKDITREEKQDES